MRFYAVADVHIHHVLITLGKRRPKGAGILSSSATLAFRHSYPHGMLQKLALLLLCSASANNNIYFPLSPKNKMHHHVVLYL